MISYGTEACASCERHETAGVESAERIIERRAFPVTDQFVLNATEGLILDALRAGR
jgi:hypothetical protein